MTEMPHNACAECPAGKHGIVNVAGRCMCCAEDMFPALVRDDSGRTYAYSGRDESDPSCGMYDGMSGYSFTYHRAKASAV